MNWAACEAYLQEHCNPGRRHGLDWPDSSVRYAFVLWTLADCIWAKSILEIGVGPSAASGSTFILNMATRGGGQLISIDIDPNVPREKDLALAKAHGVDWRIIHSDSLNALPYLPPGLSVDLLYVDGDHDCTHAYRDTLNFLPFLRPGGYLVIDDYPAFDGVTEARQMLLSEGFTFVHLSHEPPHGNGRLVWQKPHG